MSPDEILSQRKNKFLKIGRDKGFINNPENLSNIENKNKNVLEFFKNKKNIFYFGGILILLAALVIFIL